MGWNYRKRIKIAPGIHLNLSKGGVSTSIGPKGAKVTFGKNGTYLNKGIPGTGLYSREKLSGRNSSSNSGCAMVLLAIFLLMGVAFAVN
jgi:hypothetical protein